MAFTVPETIPSHDSRVVLGDRKVFVALRDHLSADCLVYYDIPVEGRYPDFIVVGPDLGLVLLEVKDSGRPQAALASPAISSAAGGVMASCCRTSRGKRSSARRSSGQARRRHSALGSS